MLLGIGMIMGYRPKLTKCGTKKKQMFHSTGSGGEQDPNEWLIRLINSLHNGLQRGRLTLQERRNALQKGELSQETINLQKGEVLAEDVRQAAIQEAQRIYHQIDGESLMSNLQYGQHEQTLTCGNCRGKAKRYSMVTTLQLHFPNAKKVVTDDWEKRNLKGVGGKSYPGFFSKTLNRGVWVKETGTAQGYGQTVMLNEMLNEYYAPTNVKFIEPCVHCGQISLVNTSEQKLSISPKLLIVQIMRFGAFDIDGNTPKIRTNIVLDNELNIEPYVVERNRNTKYRLVGIVNHHGSTVKGGHYTAHCLIHDNESGKNKWRNLNDKGQKKEDLSRGINQNKNNIFGQSIFTFLCPRRPFQSARQAYKEKHMWD